MSNAFAIVEAFETALAEFSGARYAVAVNTGTSAIFLSLAYEYQRAGALEIICPAHTFVSVPMAVKHAGHKLVLHDIAWNGAYRLEPSSVIDGALRFKRGMYQRGLHCLSFHARKLLNIGEGGAVLTDDAEAAAWLRRARYSGRDAANGYKIENVNMLGWQLYMVPEKAARGLHLMEYIADDLPDQVIAYNDLRECPVFQ
jgi:dTDP-4-amino-4,6-dideoxygalactose transaminase